MVLQAELIKLFNNMLILHVLYNKMFDSASVPSGSLMGMILPLFKGKGFKACGKDNYRGITICFQ